MRMRSVGFCLGMGLWAAGVGAGAAQAGPVTEFKLDNGLDVVVIEDHRAPVAVQMVWYRIGAADEARGHSGIAHFLEHLMFQGTEKVAPGDLSKIVAAEGGSDSAFTSWDYTAYFQRVAADRLERVMDLESDRMRNLRLTEDDVTTERQVILEERSQRTDSDPGALFNEQMDAAQFLNHPYGTPVIGWRQEMAALTRQDALDFYAANYAPNNAILVVAGDVTPDQVKTLAQKYYGPVAPSDHIKPRLRPQEPPQLAARHITMSDPRVAQDYLLRSYLAPERNSGDQKEAAALTVLAELLGGNPTTSVLARALQFGDAKAVYTSASYDGLAVDPTNFQLAVVPAPGQTQAQTEAALDAVLTQFLAEGPRPEDLARIKAQIRAADIYAQDDAQHLAGRYGQALAVGLTVQDVQDWPKLLEQVSADDVMAAARKVLVPAQSVTGWLQKGEAK